MWPDAPEIRPPMSFRHNRTLRSLARRLPVVGSYERRIAQLTAELTELQGRRPRHADSGLWVPPGHFYSPIPPLDEIRAREAQIFGRDQSVVPGVDLRVEAQLALLAELELLTADVEFARTEPEARDRGDRYWTDNPSFADGDGLFLTAMLRHLRPRRLVELGCGYSSACTLDARDKFLDGSMSLTFVDPYADLLESLLRQSDRGSVEVLAVGTQDVDLEVFRGLGAGDVLFIDSTHVSRTGSDVNRIFFDILPVLAEGVIVHLHDVFPNFEYPPPWVYEGRSWTEQYVLHTFLQYNDTFEIILWPVFLHSLDPGAMVARFPDMARNCGGSFWFRKVR